MNSLLSIILLVATICCSFFQLHRGFNKKCIFSFALSSSAILILFLKGVASLKEFDFGSNYQYAFLFPISMSLIIKTFIDLDLNLYLRLSLIAGFFIGGLGNTAYVNEGQSVYKAIREKVSRQKPGRSVLNIVFHPDNPFIEEVAFAYSFNSGFTNTLFFSVPILTNQYEKIDKFKKTFGFINVIYLDRGEEKIAAETLEAFLAKDYSFLDVKFFRESVYDNLLEDPIPLTIKNSFYKLK